jgi:hypothetical protein
VNKSILEERWTTQVLRALHMDQESRTASLASEHSPEVEPSLHIPSSPRVLVSSSSSSPREHTNPDKSNTSGVPINIRSRDSVRRRSRSGRFQRNTSRDLFSRYVKSQAAAYNLSPSMRMILDDKIRTVKRGRHVNTISDMKKLTRTMQDVSTSSRKCVSYC